VDIKPIIGEEDSYGIRADKYRIYGGYVVDY